MKRKVILLITLMLVFLLVLNACSSGNTPKDNSKDAVSTGADADTSNQPKDKLRIFQITASITYPDSFDFTDNFIVDELEEMANVEIVEAIVPPDTDVKTKFNLMMASGDICDVIHTTVGPADVYALGKTGAFVELTDIIKESPTLSKLYTPAQFELLKADDGKIYALRAMLVDGDASSFAVRYDLLEELGYTSMPDTMEGWIGAMRKLKAKYPDSLPYISREELHWTSFVFKSYGCEANGFGWQYYKGKAIHTFENPMYKEALKTYRMMIDEGLMDKEFPTDKVQDFQDKRLNRKVLVNQQNIGGMVDWIDRYPKNNIPKVIFIPGQYPKINDDRIEKISVYGGPPTFNGHTISISSTSKHKEGAVRFIEALYSDKNKELSTWGREGIEYSIVNGEKILNLDKANETSWRMIYNFPFGYNTKEKLMLTVKQFIASTDHDEAGKQRYEKLFIENAEKTIEDSFSVDMNPFAFIILDTDTGTRLTEAQNEARTIAIKAMIGELSLEEFDAEAAAFTKKYQFITDEYNKKLPEAKIKAGIK